MSSTISTHHDEDPENQSISSSSSNEIAEDTDAFLFSIESKLRSEFSSLELCKSISTSKSSSKSLSTSSSSLYTSSKRYLRLLKKTFEQMTRPIKLRVLIALLSLDSFELAPKLQKILQEILVSAEGDDDQWVRILSGVIQGTLYRSKSQTDHHHYDNDGGDGEEAWNDHVYGGAALKLLEKTCQSIVKDTEHHAMTVNALRNQFSSTMEEAVGNNNSNNKDHDIKIDRIVADLAPLFAPLRYTLLSPEDLHTIIPECFDNDHFVSDPNASILKVDEEQEKIQAEEERKEMIQKLEQERRLEEMRKKKKARLTSSTNATAATSSGGRMMTGRGDRGRVMAGRGAMIRGRGNALAGRGKLVGRGSMTGRGNMTGRGKRGLDAGGSSFMRASKRPMAGKGRMARPSQSKTSSTTLSSTQRGGRAMKNARSKMKMIDVAEVKGLKEEQEKNEEEEKRIAKRRKIKEMSGINRKKGGWGKNVILKEDTGKEEQGTNVQITKSTAANKTIDGTLNVDSSDTNIVPINNSNNFSTSIANNAPNTFMDQQDNSIPELPTIPLNQGTFPEQTLEDPTSIQMKNTFHQGQLLHEQLLHEQHHTLQNQNIFQPQTSTNTDQSNPHIPNFQFNDQLQHESQLQYNQQFPLNDALMHLQPQFYDQNLSNFDSNTNLQSSFLEPQQQQQQQQHHPSLMTQNWHALLEKSNKLTLQDRNRIEQFFGSQYNPTPNEPIYRMKLNEEKKQLEDGSYGKETLYLELNYNTFEYKKLKKIKNY